MRTLKLVAACVIAFMGVGVGLARASGTAGGQTDVVVAIANEALQDLNFGNIIAGGTDGTVKISTASVRTFTGGASAGPANGEACAIFRVTGHPGDSYSISLPSSVTIEHNAETMLVNTFVSTPGGVGILSGAGEQQVNVGATLHVSANQQPGSYSHSFDVTVAYN